MTLLKTFAGEIRVWIETCGSLATGVEVRVLE